MTSCREKRNRTPPRPRSALRPRAPGSSPPSVPLAGVPAPPHFLRVPAVPPVLDLLGDGPLPVVQHVIVPRPHAGAPGVEEVPGELLRRPRAQLEGELLPDLQPPVFPAGAEQALDRQD